MRLLVLSDTHFEFHHDGGMTFLQELPPPEDVDVVVLAGDIDTMHTSFCGLRAFCERYPHVVYVAGNHEYYHSSPAAVHQELDAIGREYPNFHWLLNKVVEIEGQRFVGTTLWMPDCPSVRAVKEQINDFHLIQGFEPWVFHQNALAHSFLMTNLQEGDVVVTHHAPSMMSNSAQFRFSPLTVLFADPHDDLIRDTCPALWVHGHMHNSSDYPLGEKARVVCNPFGYARREENVRFDWAKVIVLDR